MFLMSFSYIRLKGALHEILLGLLPLEHATRAAIRVDAVDERRSASTVGLTLRHDNRAARRAVAVHPLRPCRAAAQSILMSFILQMRS